MSETMMLPMRPDVGLRRSNSGLSSRVHQIEIQRGAFRHVTEQSLREEIDKSSSGVLEVKMEGESDEEDEETPEQRQEMVWKAREEMLKQLDRAKNDTLHALDFVSFLLSKHSVGAQSSMSPFLQQSVPIGTLDGRVLKEVEPSLAAKRRMDAVSRGWKTKSFASAAEKILNASSRLEKETERESSFWEQIAEVQSQGWSVSRLPQDSRAIGVHFGFTESAPKFRSRGFALLRQGSNGKLDLDRNAAMLKKTTIQVSVTRHGRKTGISSLRRQKELHESPVLNDIERSRNALLEEELFYEIGREGRSIANQGVVVSSDTVSVKVDESLQFEIASVHPGEDEIRLDTQNDQALAETLALGLRLLLMQAHSTNLKRRSQRPPALSMQLKPNPEYPLLRPIISLLRRQATTNALRALFTDLKKSAESAGLPFSVVEVSNTPSDEGELDGNFLESLLGTGKFSFDIELPTKRKLILSMESSAGPPTYGTQFSLSPLSYVFIEMRPSKANMLTEAVSLICNAVAMDIMDFILTLASSAANKQLAGIDDDITDTRHVLCNVIDSHSRELTLKISQRTAAALSIRVERDRIGIRARLANPMNGAKGLVWIWNLDKFTRVPAEHQEESSPQQVSQIITALIDYLKSNQQG